MLTILVVDDIAEMRTLLRLSARRRGGMEVVADAASGRDAIRQAAVHCPDVVVLDLGLPDLPGGEVLTQVRIASPESRVVIFSGTHIVDRGMIERTADAHVTKGEGVDLLFDVIDDVASSPPQSASLALDPRRDAVARARTFAADHCRAWNCVERLNDIVLIVSELATNAVVHARTGHVVTMRRRSGAIRIEVRDASARAPDLRELSVTEESGRGMLLVSALAVAWGVEPNDDGKLVWADVLCKGRAPVSA